LARGGDRVGEIQNMKAVLNLENGDYKICLSPQEVLLLQISKSLQGELSFEKNGTIELHAIFIHLKPRQEIAELKKQWRAKRAYFNEGPHVMTQFKNEVHTIYYTAEETEDLIEKLLNNIPSYQENRYDSFTGRKIFLYCQ
jgi:hypothetical protein